ncbi:MAG: helix-turn-helix domain-containing protein [Chloroflexota bacterium]|nr:helix-turn-helix domain-containing protein [Chloroflexota bacterium]
MTDRGDTGDVPDGDASRTGGTSEAVALSTAEAAQIAGVSARTIRRWIEKGALPAVAGAGGALYVFPQDLEAARIASGSRPSPVVRDRRDSGDVSAAGTVRDIRNTDGDKGHVPDVSAGAVSPAARSQLEAIRDEWLAPLVDQIREQAEEIGRLQAERSAAVRERDDVAARLADDRKLADHLVNVLQAERDAALAEVERLRASQDAPHASPAPQHEARLPDPSADASVPWWKFWERWG